MDFELRNEIKNQPITVERLNLIYDYLYRMVKQKRIILKRFIEQGRDTADIEYELAYVEYVAGLRDMMPKEYWKKEQN